MSFLASVIQINSSSDIKYNIEKIIHFCQESVKLGATFIALPEYAFQMSSLKNTKVWEVRTHPGIHELKKFSKSHKVWILGGSVPEKTNNGNVHNRSYVISDQGIEGYYNKIHLFDDYLNGESQYKESTFYTAGTRVRVVCAPWGTIGLSICFDLRYPCLYNKLVRKGANIIVVPSAFTYVTGHAHWVTLIKARAIETQSFIIAPAQCGTHDDGRKTYGHSLIVSPWGEILNNAQEEEGCFSHIIDLKEVSDCRSKIKMSHSCQTIGKNYEKDIGI